jgi:hypothetical protein
MAKKSHSVGKPVGRSARIAPSKNYRILVDVSPHETTRNLGAFRLDHCCMPQAAADETGTRRLHAYASGSTVTALRHSGRRVEVLADADAEGKRLQKFVGKGDRFGGGRRGPRGVGKLV